MVCADAGARRPPRKPKTLVDVDSPDDMDALISETGDEGPEEEEMPEIDVPEIESPDDGGEVLENSGGGMNNA